MHRSLPLVAVFVALTVVGCRAQQLTHQPAAPVWEGDRVGLGADSDVLYVLDGRVLTRGDSSGLPTAVRNLDPRAIRSVEVLKGAAAKRAYGEAGASGVVVITTKNGR